MDDEADTVYLIKYIDDASETATRPVVVGKRTNAGESYSALAAIFNTLLLRRDVSLPSFGAESIGSGEMKALIVNFAIDTDENNCMAILEALPRLSILEVDWACTHGLRLAKKKIEIFHLLDIPLLNGTVMDPSRGDDFAVYVKEKTEDSLKARLETLQDPGASDTGGGAQLERAMLEVASSCYRPLTPHGYRMLQQNVGEGKHCIAAFGGRFYTLTKHKRELYVLVTDAELINDNRVMWSKLSSHYGQEFFVRADFSTRVSVAAEIDDFSSDLDWRMNEATRGCMEDLQGYRVLGFDPVNEDTDAFEQAQMAALEFNPAGSDGNAPAGGAGRNTEETDHEMALRLQAEYNSESTLGPDILFNSERDSGVTLGPDALQSAITGAMRDTGASSGSPPRAAPQSIPSRRWNLDLVVGIEVRHKYHFNRYMFMNISDAPDWEIWNRGANALRYHPYDIKQVEDLVLVDLDEPVAIDCRAMVNGIELIIPRNMREAAELLLSGDCMDREDERSHLQRLLNGDNFVIDDNRHGGKGTGTATVESGSSEQNRDEVVESKDTRRKKWAKAIVENVNLSTYVHGSALKAVALGPNAGEEETKGFEQVVGDLVACRVLQPKIGKDGLYAVKLRESILGVFPGPAGKGVYVIGHGNDPLEVKESDVRYGELSSDVVEAEIPARKGEAKVEPSLSAEDHAATAIQTFYRSKCARRDYELFRPIRISSVTRIQASWRGHSVRSTIRRNSAATTIEAFGRVVLARRAAIVARKRLRLISWLAEGYAARRHYGPAIRAGVAEWKLVQERWAPVLRGIEKARARKNLFSWAALKKSAYDISQAEADEDTKEINERIDAARDLQAYDGEDEDCNTGDAVGEDEARETIASKASEIKIYTEEECDELPSDSYDDILLTASVLKWFRNADALYKGFFLRRMRQFANGEYERSQKLRKLLRGSKHIIWECYLEQKVAQRILFTECHTKNEAIGSMKKNILVWYVSKHDNVTRCMAKIDDSEGRMNRQAFKSTASCLLEGGKPGDGGDSECQGTTEDGGMILSSDTILLDPMGNTPLKIHELPFAELDKLNVEDWKPPFRLTRDERKIVQTPGTVLVLGRSGTGKTVCIVNKMVYDVDYHEERKEPLKQLFVSRSSKIKNLVQGFVLDGCKGSEAKFESVFKTYDRMVRECNETLVKLGQSTTVAKMEFAALERKFDDFEEQFFPSAKKELKVNLSALVVWTQIRTYIKGSIESVMVGRPLTEDEYFRLGRNYCRLKQEQRKEAYAVYKKYAAWLADNEYYDSCDRTVDIMNRLRKISPEDRAQNKLRWDKIYIDECQDFPSADFALFWMLCQGGGDLFLAGDTAQSVESGISFRFEEVKRVFYEMNNRDSSGVPHSPLSIHINFRSHSGVLEVASAVLKILHDAFPGAANKLRGDEGLFKGPRPCLLSKKGEKNLGIEPLVELLKKNPSLVLLTPDENTDKLKSALNIYLDKGFVDSLVLLGICEAKGMDYDEVIIVDFFSSASRAIAKGWKELLRQEIRQCAIADTRFQEKYPELEMRLKLLYTAITRCRHRLFFVETNFSDAGDAYSRWVMGTNLAEKQDIADLTLTLKSTDEWRTLGIEYAMHAEEQETATEAEAWFKRAANCFSHANDEDLSAKTDAQTIFRARASKVFESRWDEAKGAVPQLIADCFQESSGFIDEALAICERFRDLCHMKETKLKDKVDETLSILKKAKKDFEEG